MSDEKPQTMTIGDVGKFRAAEAIAAIRVHGRREEEEANLIIAMGLYMIGAIVVGCEEGEPLKTQLGLIEQRLMEVVRDLREEIKRGEAPHGAVPK